jgi:lysophospholipase L1-like esterase
MNKNYGKYGYILLLLIIVFGGYLLLNDDTSGIDRSSIANYPIQSNGPILAFGDSLVSGVGADTNGGFVTMLSEMIDEPILNYGRGGDTTELALSRIDEVLAEDPRLTLILLGGNDYLNRTSKEKIFNNLEQIITKFQERGSITVLLGVRGGLLRDSYGSDYRRLAEETGSAYVPNVLDGLIGNDEFMDDAIHPNEEGHRMIAEKIYPTLEELLR